MIYEYALEEDDPFYDDEEEVKSIPNFDHLSYLEKEYDDHDQQEATRFSLIHNDDPLDPRITEKGRNSGVILYNKNIKREVTDPNATFHPKINPYHGERPKDFLEAFKKDDQIRKMHKEQIQKQMEEKKTEGITLAPKITAYSQNLHFTEPAWLRLHKLAAQGSSDHDPEDDSNGVRSPSNSEGSEKPSDRYKYLYKDAENRRIKVMNRMQDMQWQIASVKAAKKLSKKSVKLLERQFTKETLAVLEKLREGSTLPVSKLREALELLNIFDATVPEPSTEDASETSSTSKSKKGSKRRRIEENSILQKLVDVLDHEAKGHVNIEEFVSILYECFKRDVSNDLEEDDSAQHEARQRVIKDFMDFMRSNLAYKKIGHFKQPAEDLFPWVKECSFTPKINKNSTYSKKMESEAARHEMLHGKAAQLRNKLKKMKEELDQKEVKGCTFQPELKAKSKSSNVASDVKRHELLFNKSKVMKKAVTSEEKAASGLKFQPESETQDWDKKFIPKRVPKGFSESVSRLRYGQLKRELKESLIKENPPVLPTSPPVSTSYAQRHLAVGPQRSSESSSSALQNRSDLPLVFVDINLGKDTIRVGFHQQDDPVQMVKAFTTSFGLNDSQQKKLFGQLTSIQKSLSSVTQSSKDPIKK